MASGSVEIPIPVNRPWLPPFEEFAALARDIFERRYISNFGKYSELLEERAGAALGRDMSRPFHHRESGARPLALL